MRSWNFRPASGLACTELSGQSTLTGERQRRAVKNVTVKHLFQFKPSSHVAITFGAFSLGCFVSGAAMEPITKWTPKQVVDWMKGKSGAIRCNGSLVP